MVRSNGVSSHMLINARTNSHWDRVDFAVIHLTESFKTALHHRLSTVQQFVADESFYNLIYWESPLGYYWHQKNKTFTKNIIGAGHGWAFIDLDDQEEQTFTVQQNALEAHQLIISKHGYASFNALSKFTNEEYLTEWFSIPKILYYSGVLLINSS